MSDKKLILVVDDDPDLVDMVATKLEANNYRIAKAYDGVQAWEKIRQEKPGHGDSGCHDAQQGWLCDLRRDQERP